MPGTQNREGFAKLVVARQKIVNVEVRPPYSWLLRSAKENLPVQDHGLLSQV